MPEVFPFEISFRKMDYALERSEKLSLAMKVHGVYANVLVDQNTANIRGRLCAQCHNNKPESEARSGCVISEKDVFNKVSKEIVKSESTPYDPQLQSCNIDGGDNKLSIWLFPAYLLNRQDITEFPTFCWKKEVL